MTKRTADAMTQIEDDTKHNEQDILSEILKEFDQLMSLCESGQPSRIEVGGRVPIEVLINREMTSFKAKLQTAFAQRPVEKPKRILRVMMFHEEGMCLRYFDYVLPEVLPLDLNPKLAFLTFVVPQADGILRKRPDIKEMSSPCYVRSDLRGGVTQFALNFEVGAKESFFDDEGENIFFSMIEQLCGPPVENQTGLVFTVCIPTAE